MGFLPLSKALGCVLENLERGFSMAEIPDEMAATVLAKCGRRCCICRRFRPTLLQVHHIDERAAGGGNDFDNLIALCLTCHTDVHSRVPFTRRFTSVELKQHRENLYQLVADCVLPTDEEGPTPRIEPAEPTSIANGPKLIPEAVKP
jgi:hypothetical protein